MEIKLKDKIFTVKIHYKKIKNLILRVEDERTLLISAPQTISKQRIEDFIRSKTKWILKNANAKANPTFPRFQARQGSIVSIFGKMKTVVLVASNRNQVLLQEDCLLVMMKKPDSQKAEKLFTDFAKEMLAQVAEPMQLRWQPVLQSRGKINPHLSFKKMKSKWGYCLVAKNEITLSTYLIHYPLECTEAVYTHECAHLWVQNHSQQFYQVLNELNPNYAQAHQLLKFLR